MKIALIPSRFPNRVRSIHRATLTVALAGAAASMGCSGTETTDAGSTPTIAVISGADQSVVINESAELTSLPQPVVLYVEDRGAPVARAELRAEVWMNGAPGPGFPTFSVTDAAGRAAMNVRVSNIPGPFRINVAYILCVKPNFKGCDQSQTLATVQTNGIAARRPNP